MKYDAVNQGSSGDEFEEALPSSPFNSKEGYLSTPGGQSNSSFRSTPQMPSLATAQNAVQQAALYQAGNVMSPTRSSAYTAALSNDHPTGHTERVRLPNLRGIQAETVETYFKLGLTKCTKENQKEREYLANLTNLSMEQLSVRSPDYSMKISMFANFA
jgi:hypothetical protein